MIYQVFSGARKMWRRQMEICVINDCLEHTETRTLKSVKMELFNSNPSQQSEICRLARLCCTMFRTLIKKPGSGNVLASPCCIRSHSECLEKRLWSIYSFSKTVLVLTSLNKVWKRKRSWVRIEIWTIIFWWPVTCSNPEVGLRLPKNFTVRRSKIPSRFNRKYRLISNSV